MKYLECLRVVFGGGAAAPPRDAADALARGAKRLRTVIEVETRAGQALAALWAGAHAVSPCYSRRGRISCSPNTQLLDVLSASSQV